MPECSSLKGCTKNLIYQKILLRLNTFRASLQTKDVRYTMKTATSALSGLPSCSKIWLERPSSSTPQAIMILLRLIACAVVEHEGADQTLKTHGRAQHAHLFYLAIKLGTRRAITRRIRTAMRSLPFYTYIYMPQCLSATETAVSCSHILFLVESLHFLSRPN